MAETLKDFYNLRMSFRALALLAALFLTPFTAKAQFGLHAASHLGYGRMGSSGGSRPSRGMGTFDLQVLPGYKIMGAMAGLMLDYRLMSQLANEADVGSDYGGRSLLCGLAILYEPGPLKLLAGYDFRARHWFSGPTTTFSGSGFRLAAGYKFMPGFAFDLEYVSTRYNSAEVDGVANGLNNDDLHHWNIGVGISYSL